MVINVINHLVDLFIEPDRLIDKLLIRDHRNFSPTFYYTAGDTESRVPSDGSEISATGVTDQVSHELLPPADSETQRSTQSPRPVLTLPFLGLRQWGRSGFIIESTLTFPTDSVMTPQRCPHTTSSFPVHSLLILQVHNTKIFYRHFQSTHTFSQCF